MTRAKTFSFLQATSEFRDLTLCRVFSAMFKSSALGTFDDYTAPFAAVRGLTAMRQFYFFEIIVPLA
jgi:hypothetical protein